MGRKARRPPERKQKAFAKAAARRGWRLPLGGNGLVWRAPANFLMNIRKVYGSKAIRTAILLVAYAVVVLCSRWLSYQLRFDFSVPAEHEAAMWGNWAWELAFELLFLFTFGQFSVLLSFFSLPDLSRLCLATGLATTVQLAACYCGLNYLVSARGVLLIDWVIVTLGLASVRVAFRVILGRMRARNLLPRCPKQRRVAIVGAGDVGAQLAKDLLARDCGMLPVAFFDDDRGKWKADVHGLPVIGAPEWLPRLARDLRLDAAVIAMPSASVQRVSEVVRLIREAALVCESVPSYYQLATGQVKVTQVRPVDIEDLLGREPVNLNTANILQMLSGKGVMVTGAGGSIGAELCRQTLAFGAGRVLLVEQCEVQLFQIEQELIRLGYGGRIVPLIADVVDAPRMNQIFEQYRPHTLLHAAAHKHVPMMESQPGEAVKNNALATARLAGLAQRHGVERFVLISTDKAVNPTNVMGCTKRLAELFVQAMHHANGGATRFMAVRFGNVLGSSGSVVPLFTRQIAAGGPVTVTDPGVTRYFMTIPEAVGLVLQCGAQGLGGEIFVLDMGKPVKIVDMARQMIELSGLRPDHDIQIEFTGLRPGEKMFEEICLDAEHHQPTVHPRIHRFVGAPVALESIRGALEHLEKEIPRRTPAELKGLLKTIVPEYVPDTKHDEPAPAGERTDSKG